MFGIQGLLFSPLERLDYFHLNNAFLQLLNKVAGYIFIVLKLLFLFLFFSKEQDLPLVEIVVSYIYNPIVCIWKRHENNSWNSNALFGIEKKEGERGNIQFECTSTWFGVGSNKSPGIFLSSSYPKHLKGG